MLRARRRELLRVGARRWGCLVLRDIIHDWEDDRAIAILTNCRRAMADGARVILVERYLSTDPHAALSVLHADLEVLVNVEDLSPTALVGAQIERGAHGGSRRAHYPESAPPATTKWSADQLAGGGRRRSRDRRSP